MSALVDQQRKEDARASRDARIEALLLELLATVRARRELTWSAVAERTGRCERTSRRRQQLLNELLERISKKGIRQPTK